MNDKDELLVVQERFYSKPHWKLPGGYVEISKSELFTSDYYIKNNRESWEYTSPYLNSTELSKI